MGSGNRQRIMAWVGSEILPHEAHVRAWLRRMLGPDDIEDVIQEAYCRISGLDDVGHIRNGRAYLFTTAKMLVLERIRRSRVVNIETVTEIDALNIIGDEPSPERIAAGRRELARVRRMIEGLPDRCRRVFELRKIEGLSQREVAQAMNLPEHTVENDVEKGLKLILKAIAEGEEVAEMALSKLELKLDHNERTRDTRSDQ
ncbi:MAG: sigma-70 family RNA polymerase sigma factor [Sphingomonas sp.]